VLANEKLSDKTKGCKTQDRQPGYLASGRLQRLISTRFHKHFKKATCATVADTTRQKLLWPEEERRLFNHFSNTDHTFCFAEDGEPPCRTDPKPDTKGQHVTCKHQLAALRQLVKERYTDRLDVLVIPGIGACTTSVVESYNAVCFANSWKFFCLFLLGLGRALLTTPSPPRAGLARAAPCMNAVTPADRPVVVHQGF